MYDDLLARYKTKEAFGSYARAVDGHPIYWMLIQLAQSGSYESIDVLSSRYGVTEDALKLLIDAARSVEDSLPLVYATNEITGETNIRIEQDVLHQVWEAAMSVSPEHMPPTKVVKMVGGKKEEIDSRLVIDVFRGKIEQYNAIDEMFSICSASIENKHIEKTSFNDVDLILARTGYTTLAILPTVGLPENGYYSSRSSVLEARAIAQELEESQNQSVRAILVSYGFTENAKSAALLDPRVTVVPIWVFLRLFDAIHNLSKNASRASLLILDHITDIIDTKGLGPFFDGSLVNLITEYLLAPTTEIPAIFSKKKLPRVAVVRACMERSKSSQTTGHYK